MVGGFSVRSFCWADDARDVLACRGSVGVVMRLWWRRLASEGRGDLGVKQAFDGCNDKTVNIRSDAY